MPKTLGLYIHIPFCQSKCIYCDFYSLPRAGGQMDAYLAALLRELSRFAPPAAAYTVDSIYFGGGTPSCFGFERLCRVLEHIVTHYRVSADAEITAEANPDSARGVSALRTARECGFNRISLGMQSADNEELRRIGRIHTHSETCAAVEAARTAGFDNLSLDLIYGLPEQTMPRFMANLSAAVSLCPEHLSCYGLKIEEGTPLFAKRESFTIPDDDLQADEYLACVDFLGRHGYAQYEISNFARAARASRHNLKYWTLGEYLGFGPGAHSDFGGRRFAAARDLRAFLADRQTLSEDAAISDAERRREYLMLSLRTARGVCETEYGAPFDAIEKVLAMCEKGGLALRADGRWRLTPQGFLLSNAIISRVLDATE